jgi:hypothetical protein
MNQEEVLVILDKMISLNKNKDNDEIWISLDIFKNITIREYKGYTLHTSELMPEDYMIIGKMYY